MFPFANDDLNNKANAYMTASEIENKYELCQKKGVLQSDWGYNWYFMKDGKIHFTFKIYKKKTCTIRAYAAWKYMNKNITKGDRKSIHILAQFCTGNKRQQLEKFLEDDLLAETGKNEFKRPLRKCKLRDPKKQSFVSMKHFLQYIWNNLKIGYSTVYAQTNQTTKRGHGALVSRIDKNTLRFSDFDPLPNLQHLLSLDWAQEYVREKKEISDDTADWVHWQRLYDVYFEKNPLFFLRPIELKKHENFKGKLVGTDVDGLITIQVYSRRKNNRRNSISHLSGDTERQNIFN